MRRKITQTALFFPFLIEFFHLRGADDNHPARPYTQEDIFDLQGNVKPGNQNSKKSLLKTNRTKAVSSSWILDVIEAQNSSPKMIELPVLNNSNLGEEIRKKILCLKD